MELDARGLNQSLGQTESLRLDFKASKLFTEPPERVAENLSAEVSAFANTEGGTIVIGIVERREGKSRIAERIDDGVLVETWPPERLEQLVTSNVSPYLPGIRLRTIPLDESNTRYAYAIAVPSGTTAYQARDRRYYGRSEYQSVPLLDHDIRLRMFRGKVPSALIRIAGPHADYAEVLYKDISHSGYQLSPQIKGRFNANDSIKIMKYTFDTLLENTGEVNITEFKMSYTRSVLGEADIEWSIAKKDGLVERVVFRTRSKSATHINIFPGDTYYLYNTTLCILQDECVTDIGLCFK